MPIDEAMEGELAEAWLEPLVDALRLSPTHPLRDDALRAARDTVYESYAGLDHEDFDEPFNSPHVTAAIAHDVVAILRGVAGLIIHQEQNAEEAQR